MFRTQITTCSPEPVYLDGDYTYRLFDKYAALTAYTGDSESVTVSEKVNGLPVQVIQGAFAGNTTLQTVNLPETLLEISYGADGVGAFEECSSLQSVTLRGETMPVSLTRVAYHAFRDCTALTQITLPVTVSRIGAAAFENCEALQLLEIYAKRCILCLVHIRSHGDSDLRLCRLNGADICGEVQQRICGTGNCIHILCDDNGTDNDFADPDYHHNNHCIFQNICCNIDNARIVRKSSDRGRERRWQLHH